MAMNSAQLQQFKQQTTVTANTTSPHLTSLVNSVGSLSDQASDLFGSASKAATTQVSTLLNGSNSVTNNLTSSNLTATSGLSNIFNTGSNAVSNLANSFPDVASLFNSTANKTTSVLTNNKAVSNKGTKAAATQVTTLAADPSAAVSKPVAFVTQPVNNSMTTATTQGKGSSLIDMTKDLSDSVIDNISKATGVLSNSTSGLTTAIKNTTSSIKTSITDGATDLASMTSTVSEQTYGSVNNITSMFTGGLNSTFQAVNNVISPITGGSKGIMNTVSAANKKILNTLPKPMAKWVQATETSYIGKLSSKILNNKSSSVQNIMNRLNGISSAADILSRYNNVTGMGNSTKANTSLTDDGGGNLMALYGNNTKNQVTTLYNAAKALCKDIAVPSLNEFGADKDLYDVLMDMAAELGLSQLIDQLEKCKGAFSTED